MKTLVVPAKIENVEKVTAFVESEVEAAEGSMKATLQLNVAIDEIFSNIAFYAYEGKDGDAEISLDIQGNVLTLSFADSGLPFNPLAKDDPDITKSAEEREIGGLGIFIVKKTMDSVEYEYKDNKNILTLKKTIK